MKNKTVQQTIVDRGAVYGDFCETAYISQKLKGALKTGNLDKEIRITTQQREALEMICVKIARIVTGDPNYEDNWRDIAGYAMLGGNLTGENNNE
ncbi:MULTISPECIES: DUF6378 domain-containing protein [Pasteurellaceae]|uniref:DUF6378 domain-containing protein n=1 Tax=Pasteurella atlantica TaxID=2827233 RepID=A0AAW8CT20_9PAST|nr:DUF6378 domain-containing protein [Pasteurella atlantica]MBR0573384.1 hypothetical protein [Pasteurella atlantica]MDP8039808.1 DUF6378 domain-containing protein [Pasteurella atlantica]MDP8041825.1 DUF6378 domain-containing protein [Pasteurella atlantica]MDP8043892.1 DUF6378 domain-containing protein [Pasteurella atlantica]MDP8046105.1 DUF6378 domain-containing protein [Pasteurella atlantica]